MAQDLLNHGGTVVGEVVDPDNGGFGGRAKDPGPGAAPNPNPNAPGDHGTVKPNDVVNPPGDGPIRLVVKRDDHCVTVDVHEDGKVVIVYDVVNPPGRPHH